MKAEHEKKLAVLEERERIAAAFEADVVALNQQLKVCIFVLRMQSPLSYFYGHRFD